MASEGEYAWPAVGEYGLVCDCVGTAGPGAAGALACSGAALLVGSLSASLSGLTATCLRSAAALRRLGRLGTPAALTCPLASTLPCEAQ